MRILIATTPVAGHVNPFTALAQALLAAGHEVLWYTGRRFEDKIKALGVTFLPFEQAAEIEIGQLETLFPERAHYKGLAQLKFDLRNIFAASLEGQVADLLAICEAHRPDLLLVDIGLLGALVIKHRLKLPLVVCNVTVLVLSSPNTAPFGLSIPPSDPFIGRLRNGFLHWLFHTIYLADLQRDINAQLTTMGVPPLECNLFDASMYEPDLVLQPTTPLFEYPRPNLPDTLHFIGPILPVFPLKFHEPPWWAELQTDRPVVLVTQGTLATDPQQLMLPAIRALAHENILVVVTTANRPICELGELPANVRAEPFIPYDRLLPYVDILVTNGGYGTVQMALAYGVPVVGAGKTEEKAEICARIAWAEVGVNLKTDTPRPKQLRRAVLQVLNTPAYRQNAQRIRDDFARYNAPQQAVTLIEQLVEDRNIRPINFSKERKPHEHLTTNTNYVQKSSTPSPE